MLNKFGEELYSAVEAALASGAQDLGRALDAGQDDDDAQFLRELLDKWNLHTKALIRTCDIVTEHMSAQTRRRQSTNSESACGATL